MVKNAIQAVIVTHKNKHGTLKKAYDQVSLVRSNTKNALQVKAYSALEIDKAKIDKEEMGYNELVKAHEQLRQIIESISAYHLLQVVPEKVSNPQLTL